MNTPQSLAGRLTRVLVAVEGIDGSGKSGVARHIADHFGSIGADVVATREPGGTPEGESLRALLLAGRDDTWDPYSELLLMTAARVQHVRRVIQPALDLGKTVVTDRFAGSTIAYQGAGRGIALGFIRELHETAVGGLWPHLTVILDLDTGTALARSRQRLTQQALDEGRFEGLDLQFHEKIRQSFLDQARNAPERHVVVNAAGTVAQVQHAAIQAVMAHFAQPGSV